MNPTRTVRPPAPPPPGPAGGDARPWYREPWPWVLFGIPGATVAAGVVTIAMAAASFDGVVADDYYREGLAINRTLARDAHAQALGLTARVQFNAEGSRVRVALAPGPGPEAEVRLRVIHPSRGGADQRVSLAPVAPGLYEGALERTPGAGRWRLVVEDGAEHWRLTGAARLPAEQPVELRALATGEEEGAWTKRKQ